MKIKINMMNEKARIPERKHYNDTGADIYLMEDVVFPPRTVTKVPVGFGIELPNGFNAFMQARTSMASKGLMVNQCAIDAGYRGEIIMIVTNLLDEPVECKAGDRVGNLIITPCVYADFVENLGDERGDGAFGSTNK